MNKEWSALNKKMQSLIGKEKTFRAGIDSLFELRNQLMETLLSFRNTLERNDFDSIPFINSKGFCCKTIAYSIWHIFRIEDIVAHTLISDDEQIFFSGKYQAIIKSPIITTGNELEKMQIADFSRQLDIGGLYSYALAVKNSTEVIVRNMPYAMLKMKIPQERREKLKSLHTVSTDEKACWLIDYWLGKDIRGLIQMPFSRHWIMHTEACLKIKDKICKGKF